MKKWLHGSRRINKSDNLKGDKLAFAKTENNYVVVWISGGTTVSRKTWAVSEGS